MIASFKKIVGSQKGDLGASLVLIAISLAMIIPIIAFVIDLLSIFSSRERVQHQLRFASLAAIEEYMGRECLPQESARRCHDERVQLARSRVNLELATWDTGSYGTSQLNVRSEIWGDPNSSNVELDFGRFMTGGELYFESDSSVIDSGINSCAKPPCFLPLDRYQPSSRFNFASAARLTTEPDFTFLTHFAAAAIGLKEVHLALTATSSVVPRRGCFVVDISPSSAYATHTPVPPPYRTSGSAQVDYWGVTYHSINLQTGELVNPQNVFDRSDYGKSNERGDRLPSYYAYTLWEDNFHIDSISWAQQTRWVDRLFNTMTDPDLQAPPRPVADDNWTRGGEIIDNTIHFKDDYRRIAGLNDADRYSNHFDIDYPYHPTPDEESGKYAVLKDYDNAGVLPLPDPTDRLYYRVDDAVTPQPLTDIMYALNQAFRTFKDRAVRGDKACLILYDKELKWPRVVRMTDDFDYLIRLSNFGPPGTLTDDVLVDDDVDVLSILSAAHSDGIIAEENGEPIDDPNSPWREISARHIMHPDFLPQRDNATNMLLGIDEALAQILANQNDENGVYASYFIVHIGDGLANCPNPDSFDQCKNKYDEHHEALFGYRPEDAPPPNPGGLEARAEVAATSNIPIHFVQLGDHVAPHSVDIQKNDNDANPVCYTDSELRADGSRGSYVNGCVFNEQACDSDRLRVGYKAASSTIPYMQINLDLYGIAKRTQGMWAPIRPASDSCSIAECRPGIRLEDPYCRPQRQQMEQYFIDIIGDNPYTVVAVDDLPEPAFIPD